MLGVDSKFCQPYNVVWDHKQQDEGAMAQLVERLTPDQKVGSSSLSGLTFFFLEINQLNFYLQFN